MSGTPEAIAARLSPAQKRALHRSGASAYGNLRTITALRRLGLVQHGIKCADVTSLGRAVRAVLEAQKP